MLWLDPAADLDRLDAFHAGCEPVAALPDDVLFERAPDVSGWSAGHHLFHIALANELALRNVHLLLEGTSAFVVREGGPSLLGFLVLSAGRMARGVGKAPRAVTPPERPDRAIVLDAHAGNVATAVALRERRDAVARARGGVPHRDLGVLTAKQWIRFAQIHGHHHLAILREVLDAVGAPVGGEAR